MGLCLELISDGFISQCDMSENNLPSAKSEPEVAPGEFDFAGPITERPRVKRRALQQATTPKTIETPVEKVAPLESRPSESTAKPATSPTRPASSTTAKTQSASGTTSTRPKIASSVQPTSPHGTRPATLYYSSGSHQEKASPSPMKTTPAASPSSSTSASATPVTRTTPAASTTRPAAVVDYRTNVERQSREQKSVGGILSIVVYVLIGLFVIGASLAGYGLYVLSKQLNQQSVTMNDFDKRYTADTRDLNTKLANTLDTLTQAQAQIGRQQELIVKQQETINKLLSATEDNATAIRTEKAARAQETANIRTRLKDLEYTGPTTRKY
jgi:hypothetical protein